MKNLIAYIDLLGRRYLGEEDDMDDELDVAWFKMSAEEKEVANHVGKLLAAHMGVDE